MTKGRVEAFSDGVIAILITLMVFQIKAPTTSDVAALVSVVPAILSFVMSFLYLGIYWNNHHHLFQATNRVNGAVLWANLNLLLWLSLIPFCTNWMYTTEFAELPTCLYGAILLLAGIAYRMLQSTIIRAQGEDSKLKQAVGSDFKGWGSIAAYAMGLGLALLSPLAAIAIYVGIALVWLIPDRRVEVLLTRKDH